MTILGLDMLLNSNRYRKRPACGPYASLITCTNLSSNNLNQSFHITIISCTAI
jgi:hypothetical protein